jgi:hypothetical protein
MDESKQPGRRVNAPLGGKTAKSPEAIKESIRRAVAFGPVHRRPSASLAEAMGRAKASK